MVACPPARRQSNQAVGRPHPARNRRSGVIAYFTTIVGLVAISGFLPTRPGLIVIAIAALRGGLWCGANFWRCRQAHCLVTGVGWLVLSALALVEATRARSFIAGAEPVVFLTVFGRQPGLRAPLGGPAGNQSPAQLLLTGPGLTYLHPNCPAPNAMRALIRSWPQGGVAESARAGHA
jgi:hypothetical protein